MCVQESLKDATIFRGVGGFSKIYVILNVPDISGEKLPLTCGLCNINIESQTNYIRVLRYVRAQERTWTLSHREESDLG